MSRPPLSEVLKPAGYPYHGRVKESPWWHFYAAVAAFITLTPLWFVAVALRAASTLWLTLVAVAAFLQFFGIEL